MLASEGYMMNQVGGVAEYNGNFWYNQEANASGGNQETDFQELVGDTGRETRGNQETAETDSSGRGEQIARSEVAVLTYDFFGKVQSREHNDGANVDILV